MSVVFYRNPLLTFMYVLSEELCRLRHYCQIRIKDVSRKGKKDLQPFILTKETSSLKLSGFAEKVVFIPINVKFPKLKCKRKT